MPKKGDVKPCPLCEERWQQRHVYLDDMGIDGLVSSTMRAGLYQAPAGLKNGSATRTISITTPSGPTPARVR